MAPVGQTTASTAVESYLKSSQIKRYTLVWLTSFSLAQRH